MAENYFRTLNDINVNGHTEQKNGLTYLSWAWAWGEIKKAFPDTTYTVYENADGWNYFTDGRTCWVKTGVTCNGIECIEYLPVMDYKNKSIPADKVTSFDINKSIQRSLTKAVARHGLGLYVYAGEDVPEAEDKPKGISHESFAAARSAHWCESCGQEIKAVRFGGNEYTPEDIEAASEKTYGRVLCWNCMSEQKKKNAT